MFIYRNSGGNLVTVTSEDGERPEMDVKWLSKDEEAKIFKERGVGQKFGDEIKFTKAGKMIPMTKAEAKEYASKKS